MSKTSAESANGGHAERRYQLLLELIPDIVYRIDTDGYFTFVNSCVRTLGYEPEELIGKHFGTIIHPDDFEQVSRQTVLAKHKGKSTGDAAAPKLFDERRTGPRMTRWLEVRLIPKDWNPATNGTTCIFGSLISVGEVAAAGVYDKSDRQSGKKLVGTVGIIRDITQRKRDEEERKRLELQYAQAQRLESLGLLAGGIAHDFKNLLTIASGYIEVAIERMAADETVGVYLEKAMNALQRSRTLTQQLLSFSKGAAPRKKLLDIRPLIKNTAGLALGESNTQPEYAFAPDLWLVDVDEGQIVQVIDNVVLNARQAMPQGGVLRIECRNLAVEETGELSLDPGLYVLVLFQDHGIGISPEHLTKVFDPFFTTKQDGSGLGLATAYFVIKKHRGCIAIDSELGKGTTVRVYLPATPPEEVKVEKKEGKKTRG